MNMPVSAVQGSCVLGHDLKHPLFTAFPPSSQMCVFVCAYHFVKQLIVNDPSFFTGDWTLAEVSDVSETSHQGAR